GVRLRVGERGARRLLHHVAELAGEDQPALAGRDRGLDEEDVAAHRRVVHAGRDAHEVVVGLGLRREALGAEVLLEAALGDPHALGLALGYAPRGLARQRADEALEVADARLARVRG